MASVTLDTVGPQDREFVDYLRNRDIKATVINENGPGGGNPEVKYEGARKSLETLIDDHFDGGDGYYLKTLIED